MPCRGRRRRVLDTKSQTQGHTRKVTGSEDIVFVPLRFGSSDKVWAPPHSCGKILQDPPLQPAALTRPYPPSPELPISAEVALAVPFSSDITQRPREGNSETCISHQTIYWGFYSHFSQFTMKPGDGFFFFSFSLPASGRSCLAVSNAVPAAARPGTGTWGPLDFHLTLSNPHSLNAP